MVDETQQRRPLKTRGAGWTKALTRSLLRTGITPNQISAIGVVFAGLGAWAMLQTAAGPWWWLAGALGIQLRLLANMMDGLVAVEGGRGGPLGALYNELPDRLEDALLLVAAGYAVGDHAGDWGWLGWLATALAITAAYVRAVGASLGLGQDYRGPMAKPHRMAALTLGCVLSLGAALAHWDAPVMLWVLAAICVGTVVTIARRTLRMAALLQAPK